MLFIIWYSKVCSSVHLTVIVASLQVHELYSVQNDWQFTTKVLHAISEIFHILLTRYESVLTQ